MAPQSQEYRKREHTGYLDQQPELSQVVRTWLESLSLDPHGAAYDEPRLEEIECRGRDGFIPHSHNRGGFDLQYLSEVSTCHGGCIGPNLTGIDRDVQLAYEYAKEWFHDKYPDILVSDIDYGTLYGKGLGNLAEELSEAEHENMNTPVWWGVRCMYEGADETGTHTLVVYASGNVCEYHDAFQNGSETLGQWELRFKTASGLRRQLERLTSKVTKAF